MHISGISITQQFSLPANSGSSRSFSTNDSSEKTGSSFDGAELNFSAGTFTSLVKEASAMPEVRNDVVQSMKSRIQSGHYPSEDVIAGLTRLMGGLIGPKVSGGSFSE